MHLPLFYSPSLNPSEDSIDLDEDSSRHMVQVLRMQAGETIQLTNGNGVLASAQILLANKKKSLVKILEIENKPEAKRKICIAISLLKNAHRFEWFLEKATEIGLHAIVPLICERTEKQHFRQDRMRGIIVSAMIQSQQFRLPRLFEPLPLKKLSGILEASPYQKKYIAHCGEEQKISLQKEAGLEGDATILIGPEGDFTPSEIEWALQQGFKPVSLGQNRLRSETAGVVAATLLALDAFGG